MQGIRNIWRVPGAPLVRLARCRVWLCSLQKPLGTYNLTGTGKRMPKIWSENKHGAKALCVDNLSCIWTSDRDLRLAIKPVVDYAEVSSQWQASLQLFIMTSYRASFLSIWDAVCSEVYLMLTRVSTLCRDASQHSL